MNTNRTNSDAKNDNAPSRTPSLAIEETILPNG